MSKFWQGVFLLSGTTIGAGVFALPYVFSKSGLLPSIIGIFFIAAMISILNYFYTKIIINTDGDRQLIGYVREYLGKKWSWVATAAFILSMNGVLMAYVVLGGEFLSLALGQLPTIFYHFWFYLLGVILFSRGLKNLSRINTWLTIILVLLMLFLPFGLAKFIQLSNLPVITTTPLFFWGAAVFSLANFTVVPEVEETLRGEDKKIQKAVIIGSWLPLLAYLPFVFGIWGTCGQATSADGLSCLIAYSPGFARLGGWIGLIALFTSFVSLANALKEVYFRDLKIKEIKSKIIAVIPAFFAIFLSTTKFVDLVSFTGAISLTISACLICLIYARTFSKSKYLAWIIAAIFILGAGTEMIK